MPQALETGLFWGQVCVCIRADHLLQISSQRARIIPVWKTPGCFLDSEYVPDVPVKIMTTGIHVPGLIFSFQVEAHVLSLRGLEKGPPLSQHLSGQEQAINPPFPPRAPEPDTRSELK